MQSRGIDKYPSAYKEQHNNYFYSTNIHAFHMNK